MDADAGTVYDETEKLRGLVAAGTAGACFDGYGLDAVQTQAENVRKS